MFKIKFGFLRFTAIAYTALVFQASLIHLAAVGGVVPDIVLLCVVFFALYNGPRRGMICGMILGSGLDALSGGIFGIQVIILGSIGFMAGLLRERVYTTHIFTTILVSAAAAFFSLAAYYIFAGQFHRLPEWSLAGRLLWGSVLYTVTANILISPLLERFLITKTYILS